MAPFEDSQKISSQRITHVIFDLDGTLVESEEMYSQMHKKALAKYGKVFDLEMKSATQGRQVDDEIRTLIRMAGLEGVVSEEEMKEPLPKITHVIFDFDGILVDSEDLYSQMHSKLLAKWGKSFSLDQKLVIQGMRKEDEIITVLRLNGLEGKITEKEYEKLYIQLYEEHLSNVKPLPGTDRLIRHLHNHKIPIAICTSSAADEFEIKTRKLKDWLDMIPVRILAGSDARIKRGKPNPDPYLQCAQDLGVDPAACLVFEDSVNGAKSAISAGMHCVMIPQWEFQCDASKAAIDKLRPQLDEVLKSMEEFKPEKYGLPGF